MGVVFDLLLHWHFWGVPPFARYIYLGVFRGGGKESSVPQAERKKEERRGRCSNGSKWVMIKFGSRDVEAPEPRQ